jgi:hypothetical protein
MFRESLQTKTARLKKIIAGFQKTYPRIRFEFASAHFSARLFPCK